MPKTAAKFGQELQLALQPMILRPSTTGGVQVSASREDVRLMMKPLLQALQETVACMCAVVQNLTHDFTRLVALLKSCNRAFIDHDGWPKLTVSHFHSFSSLATSDRTFLDPIYGTFRRASPLDSHFHRVPLSGAL